MPYFDRLTDASWVSPSGAEYAFSYESVSRDVSHRIGAFEFSNVDGTLHQDKGVSGEIYSWAIYVHGPDYDIAADAFFDAAKERGFSFLNHPRWGRRRVQVTSVSQNENLTQSAGQAVFNISFQETLEREFPKTAAAPQQILETYVSDFEYIAAEEFSGRVVTETLAQKNNLQDLMTTAANLVSGSLSFIASLDQDILTTFNQNINDIIDNAAAYVDAPIEFASRIVDSIISISKIPGRISSKVLGYKALIGSIIGKIFPSPDNATRNEILIDELITTASIVGASASVNSALNYSSVISRNENGVATISTPEIISTDSQGNSITVPGAGFVSREEVIAAVVYLEEQATESIEYLDSGQEFYIDKMLSENYIQTVESYVPAWEIVGIVIKAGLDLSFSLPVKIIRSIDTARTILDLCFEFYGNIDNATIDYFISTNALKGQDIILLPRGKEIIYYE